MQSASSWQRPEETPDQQDTNEALGDEEQQEESIDVLITQLAVLIGDQGQVEILDRDLIRKRLVQLVGTLSNAANVAEAIDTLGNWKQHSFYNKSDEVTAMLKRVDRVLRDLLVDFIYRRCEDKKDKVRFDELLNEAFGGRVHRDLRSQMLIAFHRKHPDGFMSNNAAKSLEMGYVRPGRRQSQSPAPSKQRGSAPPNGQRSRSRLPARFRDKCSQTEPLQSPPFSDHDQMAYDEFLDKLNQEPAYVPLSLSRLLSETMPTIYGDSEKANKCEPTLFLLDAGVLVDEELQILPAARLLVQCLLRETKRKSCAFGIFSTWQEEYSARVVENFFRRVTRDDNWVVEYDEFRASVWNKCTNVRIYIAQCSMCTLNEADATISYFVEALRRDGDNCHFFTRNIWLICPIEDDRNRNAFGLDNCNVLPVRKDIAHGMTYEVLGRVVEKVFEILDRRIGSPV